MLLLLLTPFKNPDITINWKIDNDGKLSSVMYAEKDDEFPVLPRFGIRMFLDKRLKNVSFYGMEYRKAIVISTKELTMPYSVPK